MSTADQPITLSEQDVAADLGAIDPAAVPSVARPDGRPGFTERYVGAKLVDGADLPTGAELHAEKAAHPAECAGCAPRPPVNEVLRLREGDQPLPTGDADAPNIHELVMADLGNRMQLGIKRYGQPLKPHNGRDPLRDAYEELLDGAAYLRQAMFERDGA